ncbi:MAG: 16S rRNA (cytidine(1402)-2'-O)-methyltransferase [Nitrospinae bacterium]|nr:16S rRNA (cytidine(1402)-2'-O)-methyltransferase [Nitrospinota bacterium]
MTANQIQPRTLYLVATPIGNLGDITYRAVEVLRQCEWIAAEDTRTSRVLLNHYGITGKNMISYYGAREAERAQELLRHLNDGASVAVITDAGTPGISDPAVRIVRLAIARGIPVVPVPGPSALLAALCASGLDTASFAFEGFLPIKSGKRLTSLKRYCAEDRTVILYESPHRIERLLEELESLIPERRIVVARELTKMFEEFLRGTPAEIRARMIGKKLKGEMVVVIPGISAHPLELPPPDADGGSQ